VAVNAFSLTFFNELGNVPVYDLPGDSEGGGDDITGRAVMVNHRVTGNMCCNLIPPIRHVLLHTDVYYRVAEVISYPDNSVI
jgi:hypothetical protein